MFIYWLILEKRLIVPVGDTLLSLYAMCSILDVVSLKKRNGFAQPKSTRYIKFVWVVPIRKLLGVISSIIKPLLLCKSCRRVNACIPIRNIVCNKKWLLQYLNNSPAMDLTYPSQGNLKFYLNQYHGMWGSLQYFIYFFFPV